MSAAKTPLPQQRWPRMISEYHRRLGTSTSDGSLLRRAFAASKSAMAGVLNWRSRGNWKIIDPANTYRSERNGTRN